MRAYERTLAKQRMQEAMVLGHLTLGVFRRAKAILVLAGAALTGSSVPKRQR